MALSNAIILKIFQAACPAVYFEYETDSKSGDQKVYPLKWILESKDEKEVNILLDLSAISKLPSVDYIACCKRLYFYIGAKNALKMGVGYSYHPDDLRSSELLERILKMMGGEEFVQKVFAAAQQYLDDPTMRRRLLYDFMYELEWEPWTKHEAGGINVLCALLDLKCDAKFQLDVFVKSRSTKIKEKILGAICPSVTCQGKKINLTWKVGATCVTADFSAAVPTSNLVYQELVKQLHDTLKIFPSCGVAHGEDKLTLFIDPTKHIGILRDFYVFLTPKEIDDIFQDEDDVVPREISAKTRNKLLSIVNNKKLSEPSKKNIEKILLALLGLDRLPVSMTVSAGTQNGEERKSVPAKKTSAVVKRPWYAFCCCGDSDADRSDKDEYDVDAAPSVSYVALT